MSTSILCPASGGLSRAPRTVAENGRNGGASPGGRQALPRDVGAKTLRGSGVSVITKENTSRKR
jgi:hypothetical protein